MTHPSKRKGSAFERLVCDYLVEAGIPAERIPAGASDDRGDIWIPGLTVQCKNRATTDLAGGWRATELQTSNNHHAFGFLVHKRHGVATPGEQWVTCDLEQLRTLIKERLL